MTLTLRAASTVVSPPARPFWLGTEAIGYFRELHEPFGVEVDESLLRSGTNISHADLFELLVQDEEVLKAAQGSDFVTIAYALPDLHPFKTVSSHAHRMFGGTGQNYAISEQGSAAPFTALRIARSHHRSERCGKVALMVLEQTTLPAHDAFVHGLDLTDSGALLVFEEGDGLALSRIDEVRVQGPGETARELGRKVAEWVDGTDPSRTMVVLGPWDDDVATPDGVAVHRTARTSYCTALWLALGAHWESWSHEYEQIILCQQDPRHPARGDLAALSTER